MPDLRYSVWKLAAHTAAKEQDFFGYNRDWEQLCYALSELNLEKGGTGRDGLSMDMSSFDFLSSLGHSNCSLWHIYTLRLARPISRSSICRFACLARFCPLLVTALGCFLNGRFQDSGSMFVQTRRKRREHSCLSIRPYILTWLNDLKKEDLLVELLGGNTFFSFLRSFEVIKSSSTWHMKRYVRHTYVGSEMKRHLCSDVRTAWCGK